MRVSDVLDELFNCALSLIEVPVCRSFKNPGDGAPHDYCEGKVIDGVYADGQLWVAHISSVAGWPDSDGSPITCATSFTETYELGIVRCAQGKLEDGLQIPDQDLITADAEQQEEDRLALKNAFLCCAAIDGRDILPPVWEPISPLGGCVGGTWLLSIRDGGCVCESWES